MSSDIEESIMNNTKEIIEVIFISVTVATFLLTTGRVVEAIEFFKESLVLLDNKALRTKHQLGKLIYRGIYKGMFEAYCRIHDNENAITYGKKLLGIYCECGETFYEGIISIKLAQVYMNLNKYVEAKELNERAIIITREIGYKKGGAVAYGNLGTVFHSLGDHVKAKEYLEKALEINIEIGNRKEEATNYRNLGTVFHFLGDHVKSKEYLEKALAINIEIGDRAGEATNYGNLGIVFRSLGDHVKTKEYLEKALAINIEIGDRTGEAVNYRNLGTVFHSLGDDVKAKEYLEIALGINTEIGDRAGEAANYGNLGIVFHSLGDHVKAKEYLKIALAINIEIGDRAEEAANYGNLGIVVHSLGDHDKAKEYLEKALAINIEIDDRVAEAGNCENLGNMFQYFGNYVKAKEYIEKAIALNVEIGDRAGEAANYGYLSSVFQAFGDEVEAKEYLEKTLAIKLEIGDRAGEATCYGSLGTIYHRMGKYRNSNEYFEKALAIKMEIGDRAGEAAVYGNLGDVFASLGDFDKAKEYLEKALAIIIEIGDRQLKAAHYVRLGILFNSLGEYDMAGEYLGKALQLSKDIRNGETERLCYLCLTMTKLFQGKIHEAFLYLFRHIKILEDLRDFNADNDQIKISFADMHVFPYELLTRLFCTSGNPINGLYVAELGRARALADLMATQYSAEKFLSANPQSWIGIENVLTKERNCICLYISYHDERLFFWILKTSRVISFREMTVDEKILHKRLPKPAFNLDELFALMAESFRSFGILPEEVCEDRSLKDIKQVESDSSQEKSIAVSRHGKGEEDPEPILTLFHEMLINPVSDLLEEPEIIIVPDRSLYRVPFAALLDANGKYLSETFRIRIIPSLTTLKLIQDSPGDYHRQTDALLVGDPDVGEVIYNGRINKKFTSLPGARKEAEMIGRLLGYPPLLGEHATKQAVLQKMHSASLIHIAAHGNAERGEIALAPSGCTIGIPKEDNYLLKLSDISKVQLQAKLVVLSCCHSGRGQIRTEGVVGIARAFLGSGARSVLVALWALEDRATENLMNCFYEHLVRGESASESLHKAMKWMRDNGFTKVSEWAPFMLLGDNVTFDFEK